MTIPSIYSATSHVDRLVDDGSTAYRNVGILCFEYLYALRLVDDGSTAYRNGGAVTLDSQGCKPLVGIPNTFRESRSDGIGSSCGYCGYPVAPKSGSRSIANAANNTIAPRFKSPERIFTRGSHPWLSNAIAPRFNTPNEEFILDRTLEDAKRGQD